ncbi:MAG: hypothetical protein Q3996_02035, partial [Candidatus Saccharibacteria bacterium]|nr:hypothetical protein [Candidatus Saccharibacteria bacterium]
MSGFIAYQVFLKNPAQAVEPFNPGNIMSDHVMSDYNSMTESEIQAFLKSKNHCNDRGIERAKLYPKVHYNIRDGHFVCMADDTFNGETAAHIIWQAAQDFKINPRVIIVLLQKEQGLITDTWPHSGQYQAATGYGCPDTAACDEQYYGLKNQIRNAAKLFRTVLNGGWTNYPVGNNYIQYNPNPACGGSNVYIENRATSALYRYTPYQPNAGALAAGWGTAHCGAYGNRNFYLYYTNWFGSAQSDVVITSPLKIEEDDTSLVSNGRKVTVSFTIKNNTNAKKNIGKMAVIVRNSDGKNYDFVPQAITLSPYSEYKYSSSQIISEAGVYNFSIGNFRDNVGWSYDYPESYGESIIRNARKTIIDNLTISNQQALDVYENEQQTVSFNIVNNTAYDSEISGYVIRDGSKIVKTVEKTIKIPPHQNSVVAEKINTGNAVGKRKITIKYLKDKKEYSFIKSTSLTFEVKPAVLITQGLTFDKEKVGEKAIASFKIKNFSSVVQPLQERLCFILRGPRGQNLDLGCLDAKTIAPQQELVFNESFTPQETGNHYATLQMYSPAKGWRNAESLPKLTNKESTSLTFEVKPAVLITQG